MPYKFGAFKLVGILLTLYILTASGRAATLEADAPLSTLLWRTPLYAIANQYLSVALHEGSHAFTASLMGYQVTEIQVGFWGGEVRIVNGEKMDDFQSTVTSLSGPFANRFAAVGINSYLDAREDLMDENVRSFLGGAYLWNRGNFAWYLTRSFFGLALFGDGQTDWGQIAIGATGGNVFLASVLLGGVVGLEVWDLWNTRDELVANFDRFLGKKSPKAATPAREKLVELAPYGKGFLMVKTISF